MIATHRPQAVPSELTGIETTHVRDAYVEVSEPEEEDPRGIEDHGRIVHSRNDVEGYHLQHPDEQVEYTYAARLSLTEQHPGVR